MNVRNKRIVLSNKKSKKIKPITSTKSKDIKFLFIDFFLNINIHVLYLKTIKTKIKFICKKK